MSRFARVPSLPALAVLVAVMAALAADGPADAPPPVAFRLASPAKPLILLDVMVNDQGPFPFVLDTGASMCVIVPALADQLGLERGEPRPGLGAGGPIQVQLATLESLAVGATKLGEPQVAVLDLAALRQALGVELSGIVGYNFLRHYRVTIDYPAQTVRFEPPRAP